MVNSGSVVTFWVFSGEFSTVAVAEVPGNHLFFKFPWFEFAVGLASVLYSYCHY